VIPITKNVEARRHVHRRVSHSERRGTGDQRARGRDPRPQIFPGTDAVWAVRAGRSLSIPAMFEDSVYVEAGGLMSYGPITKPSLRKRRCLLTRY
jgi:hypothetical protein